MITELFRASHQDLLAEGLERQFAAARLQTQHSLFAIANCFDYSDEGIVSPDQASMLWIINDLFLKGDDRFGDPANRERLKQRLSEIVPQQRSDRRSYSANLFADIADVFRDVCPHALRDVSVVLVGIDSPEVLQSIGIRHAALLTTSNQKLLGQFGALHDFSPNRNEGIFSLDVVDERFAQTKVDYVITGNVLNDPFHADPRNDVFLAAARILKTGGRALHILSTSNDFYDFYVNNPTMIALAGQKRLSAQPGMMDGILDFVALQQVKENRITRADLKEVILYLPSRPLVGKRHRCNMPYLRDEDIDRRTVHEKLTALDQKIFPQLII